MKTFHAIIEASVAGSIGVKHCESREYTIEANNKDEVLGEAITRAYDDGLEHVRVLNIIEI